MKLQELIDLAEARGACWHELSVLATISTMKEAKSHPSAPMWAWWLRTHTYSQLSEKWLRKLEQKACESPVYAGWLRLYADDLPEEVVRQAELKACESGKTIGVLYNCLGEELLPETWKLMLKLHGDPV